MDFFILMNTSSDKHCTICEKTIKRDSMMWVYRNDFGLRFCSEYCTTRYEIPLPLPCWPMFCDSDEEED